MIVELKSTDDEFGNQYDFFEIEEVELLDGSQGEVKKKMCTCTKEQLIARKEKLDSELLIINEQISLIEGL